MRSSTKDHSQATVEGCLDGVGYILEDIAFDESLSTIARVDAGIENVLKEVRVDVSIIT